MNNLFVDRGYKKRLIKESRGSFSAVHNALKAAKKNNGGKPLDIEDVLKQLKKSKRAS